MREDLNASAQRRIAVLDPVKLIIDNYPEGAEEECHAPNHPQKPELGRRALPLTRELWIERDDFAETPPKGYFRLFLAVHCEYLPDTKSGTPGAERIKVKGNIHWVSARYANAGEVRLYDRLFRDPHPGRERDFLEDLNPDSMRLVTAQLEPALKDAKPEERFQFERHGYFCADARDSRPGDPVFNSTVTLRDSWAAGGKP
jgi:glutaminyl-tRNA synthetase